MAFAEIKDPESIRKAAAEFDTLGRAAFLEKYGFGETREYFLEIDGKLYDSKAILGAAHGYEFPSAGPLRAGDFSGGEATVRRKLEEIGFTVRRLPEHGTGTLTSARLKPGVIYTRESLADLFNIHDATLNTGVFRPKSSDSVWLFVTRDKTADRTQYKDVLDGDVLHWQGQTSGRTDPMIIEHQQRGLELLLFYRNWKYEHEHAGFRYEGPFIHLLFANISAEIIFALGLDGQLQMSG